jgi:uncharacterized SAM-binding protein YcdF (DUF218 family)
MIFQKNALFSKIMLRQDSKLSTIKNIEIITSKFHLPRALYYFKTIFNSLESTSGDILQVNDNKNLNSVAIIFAKYHSEFGIDYDFSKALLSFAYRLLGAF